MIMLVVAVVVVAVVMHDFCIEHLCFKTLRLFVDKFPSLILKVCTGSSR